MKGRAILALVGLMLSGTMASHPASAHEFEQDSGADLIAKIQEFKAENKLIASNISNSSLAQWHMQKSQSYWGVNETNLLGQKDPNLSGNLSSSMADLYALVGKQNVDTTTANQKADLLNGLADQVETEVVGSSSDSNATVQALAMVNVLNEVLRDYGDAIGSKVDLTNMDNMNATSQSSMQGMSGMSGMTSSTIVGQAQYQSAEALMGVVQDIFAKAQSYAPSNSSSYMLKAGLAVSDLKQEIDSKASGMDVMTTVHMKIHPNLISALGIEAVPEFPVPLMLVLVSIAAAVVVPRVFSRK